MTAKSAYTDFLEEKGISLSTVNPGSIEFALSVNDALGALELLKDMKTTILGGDILSMEDNQLIYAYQLWGQEYHVLNWYITPEEYKSKENSNSYLIAKENIMNASRIAEELDKQCYIVLVVE